MRLRGCRRPRVPACLELKREPEWRQVYFRLGHYSADTDHVVRALNLVTGMGEPSEKRKEELISLPDFVVPENLRDHYDYVGSSKDCSKRFCFAATVRKKSGGPA